ncbi:unnamed protein product [Oikopleura dioica]|uniref:CUB domain-containing protein n=1 Tax=Oikopleura dioica TaxID=34765 RepID=E4XPS9_OIKDI|nr:unnamed protein product [Oikopleura dioica]
MHKTLSNPHSRTKQNNFRLCTATLLTPTTLITTAGCTGSDANNRLFAKIGQANFDPRAPSDHVQTIMIRRCVAHPKYVRGEPNNDLQICFLAESIKQAKGIMIPCLTDTQIKLNDGDIVVTESRTNFNKGKTEGYPMRTHIPISGKYSQGKTDKERGYAFGDPLCMKEVGSPVFREDVNQRTLVGLVQGALTPENQCPTRLFNIVDLRDHVDWITATTKMGALAAEQAEKLAQKTHGARGTNDDRLIKMPRQSADEARECGPEVISLWNLEDGGNCTNSMTISSPGYPGWYPANADCPVQIQAPENTRVRVRLVEKFDIETSPDCQADKINLNDGNMNWNLCNGQLPDMPDGIVGPSDKMDIRFTSDGTVQRTGFKLQIDCVDQLTAEKITSSEEFEDPEEKKKIKIKNQFISGNQNFSQRPKKQKQPKKPKNSPKQDARRNGQKGKKNS